MLPSPPMPFQEIVRSPAPIKVLCIACGRWVEVSILVVALEGGSVFAEKVCKNPPRGDS